MSDTSLAISLESFHAKSARLLAHGYDRLAAAAFIAQSARPYSSPLLDIGSGRGLFAVELAKLGADVTSIDAYDGDQELARHFAREAGVANKVRFASIDAAQLPYQDGAFQCVAMMDVLHHLESPDSVFVQMDRVLAPQGVLVLADLDEEGFSLLDLVGREEGLAHPRLPVSLEQAALWFTTRGFSIRSKMAGMRHELLVLSRGPSGV